MCMDRNWFSHDKSRARARDACDANRTLAGWLARVAIRSDIAWWWRGGGAEGPVKHRLFWFFVCVCVCYSLLCHLCGTKYMSYMFICKILSCNSVISSFKGQWTNKDFMLSYTHKTHIRYPYIILCYVFVYAYSGNLWQILCYTHNMHRVTYKYNIIHMDFPSLSSSSSSL